jgi:hypothetical protein
VRCNEDPLHVYWPWPYGHARLPLVTGRGHHTIPVRLKTAWILDNQLSIPGCPYPAVSFGGTTALTIELLAIRRGPPAPTYWAPAIRLRLSTRILGPGYPAMPVRPWLLCPGESTTPVCPIARPWPSGKADGRPWLLGPGHSATLLQVPC